MDYSPILTHMACWDAAVPKWHPEGSGQSTVAPDASPVEGDIRPYIPREVSCPANGLVDCKADL